jgi:hypothetical protein
MDLLAIDIDTLNVDGDEQAGQDDEFDDQFPSTILTVSFKRKNRRPIKYSLSANDVKRINQLKQRFQEFKSKLDGYKQNNNLNDNV